MQNPFNKTKSQNKSTESKEVEFDFKNAKHFLNVGVNVEIDGEQMFVALPFGIATDILEQSIKYSLERAEKSKDIKWKKFNQMQAKLIEAVCNGREFVPAGNNFTQSQLDGTEFAGAKLITKLEVQFLHKKEDVNIDEVESVIDNDLFNF